MSVARAPSPAILSVAKEKLRNISIGRFPDEGRMDLVRASRARAPAPDKPGSALRIRRRVQQIAVIHALHGIDLDVGFLVSGEGDVGKDEQGLRAVGDIEGAIEAHLLYAAFLASGLVECVGEADSLVIDLVGQMRRHKRHRQRNGRIDLDAEFLVVVVGRHQAVNLGRRRHVVFLVQVAAPFETGQHAVIHTRPAVILDVDIAGWNELLHAGTEDRADGGDDRLLGSALVVECDDHGPLGRQMALVSRAGHVLLHAEKTEIHGRVRMLDRGVPFVGPCHGDGDRMSGFDANVHIAASGCGIVNAAGVQAGGFHGDGLGVRGSPVEDAIILRVRGGDKGADEQRGD